MSKLNEADFYYGAIWSYCFHKQYNPMMLEDGEEHRVYQCTTDEGDFKLFIKYRKKPVERKTEKYNSWQFTFTDNEMKELQNMVSEGSDVSLALVCGKMPLNQSELAFLHREEIADIFSANKTSITISRKSSEKKFRISMGGGRANSMQIESNRIR